MPKPKSLEIAFWEKVRRAEGCWEWAASKTKNGYGKMGRGGSMYSAHRVSWELHNGPIQDGLCVLHRCDNRGCVNPDHLFLGTQQDNLRDMCRKGRNNSARGERSGSSKLTEDGVREIRRLNKKGFGHAEVGRMFGVSATAISCINRGLAWRHLA